MIIKKILGIPLSLSIVLLFFNGCNYEKTAHKLPLSLDVKEDNICLYTNSKNSFLDENNKVILAGNPLFNPRIEALLFQKLKENN